MKNSALKTLLNSVDRVDALLDLVTPVDVNGYRSYMILGSTINLIQKNLDFIVEIAKTLDKIEQINEEIIKELMKNHD